jgi:hypothetical protein
MCNELSLVAAVMNIHNVEEQGIFWKAIINRLIGYGR